MAISEKLDEIRKSLNTIAPEVKGLGTKHMAKVAHAIYHAAEVLHHHAARVAKAEGTAAKRAAAAEKRTAKASGSKEKVAERIAKLQAYLLQAGGQN